MRLVSRPGRRLQPLRRVSPATPVRSLAPSPASEPSPISAGARLTCHAPSGGCGGARPAPRGGPRPMGRDGRSRVRSGPAAGHGDSRDTAPPAHPARSLRAFAAVHAGSRWPPGWSSHPRPSEGRMRRRRGGGQLVRGGPGGSMLSPQRGKGHRPAPCGCAPHGPGRGRPASRRGDEDLPAGSASLAAAAGRLHCLTTAWARLSTDLQVQETSFCWKIRELSLQDRKKKTSVLLYRVPRSKTGCAWSQGTFMLSRPAI